MNDNEKLETMYLVLRRGSCVVLLEHGRLLLRPGPLSRLPL